MLHKISNKSSFYSFNNFYSLNDIFFMCQYFRSVVIFVCNKNPIFLELIYNNNDITLLKLNQKKMIVTEIGTKKEKKIKEKIYKTHIACLIFEEDNKRRIYDKRNTFVCFHIAGVIEYIYAYVNKKCNICIVSARDMPTKGMWFFPSFFILYLDHVSYMHDLTRLWYGDTC